MMYMQMYWQNGSRSGSPNIRDGILQPTVCMHLTKVYSYWQYTSSGSVAGISGNVDMNFRYIKKPEAVKNLHITSTSMQKASLKWNKVPYVYGYKIYRLDKSTNTYKHVGTTVGASNTHLQTRVWR